ncbi:substrate-binding periplasmic protein [Motilimonas sp. KMU-193]|uniref:substrate-binding periplasmic protein n=1 Tax=Motilimonas sp. KMU-193 TaxID=3388668 RepID=UPI00396B3343
MLTSYVSAAPLRLAVPQFPPYTSFENGQFSGIGVELVSQAFTQLDQPYQLISVPNYARALAELRRGRIDGFFLASENEQRNRLAVFSEPLMVNRWLWFMRHDDLRDPASESFKQQAQVASLLGSNTSVWLFANDYKVLTKAVDIDELPPLLLTLKRIDAVFLAEKVFKQELLLQGFADADYRQVEQSSKPFGIYISKSYLAHRPDFMAKLNEAIKQVKKDH